MACCSRGMFGDGSQRLELSETRQATIVDVVERLHENEEALKAKEELTLEQWYAACHKLGDELLAVLTDAQRQQLAGALGAEGMQRVHLVDYAGADRPRTGRGSDALVRADGRSLVSRHCRLVVHRRRTGSLLPGQ